MLKFESINFSSDYKILLIESADNKIQLFNVAAKTVLLQVQLEAKFESGGFRNDGSFSL